eukprot:UN31485
MQCALLYTTSAGQRRIRIHTVRVPLVNQTIQVIENINTSAYMNLFVREALRKVLGDGLPPARLYLQSCILDVLKCYAGLKGKLLNNVEDYPRDIMCWPDVVLGCFKCRAFRDIPAVAPDLRSFIFSFLNNAPVDRTDLFFRPVMYAVSEIVFDEELGLYNDGGSVILPPELP